MSFSITTAFVQQFRDALFPLAQQKLSRFRGKCIEDTITGDSGYLEQLAPTDAQDVTSRHGDSPMMNSLHLRRRVSLIDSEWGDLFDKLDKFKLLIDPASAYVTNARAALARKQDQRFSDAFFATAFTGKDGSIACPWPAGPGTVDGTVVTPGTVIAVNDNTYGNTSGNTGLTISKLISAKVALLGNEAVDEDGSSEADGEGELHFAYTSKQLGNLLTTTEATSADYAQVKALVEGKIDQFMGFKFVRYEKLPKTADPYTRCAAWAKSGMGFGIGAEVTVEMDKRGDKRFAWYAYACMSVGATRMEEGKVVEVLCA